MYELLFPGRIVFGAGALERLPQLMPQARRILLVTGNSARAGGLAGRVTALLTPERLVSAPPVGAEPELPEVDVLLDAGRAAGVDGVLAVGGGSAIDAGKTAAVLMNLDGMSGDYFYGRRSIAGPGLPFAAVPTTAGTGAEATPNAVLSDPERGIKQSIKSPFMFPALALVDPELTYTCPAAVTAASGMDALTQAIESYTARGATAPSRALAKAGVELILPALPRAFRDGDPASRSDMAEGCLLGAMAFAQSGLGAVHGLAHPVGAVLHLPHGVCCAVLLPPVMRRNAAAVQALYDRLAPDLIEQVEALCQALNLPAKLPGLKREHIPFIIANCRSGSMKTNPRNFSDAELQALLEALL